MDQIIFDEIYHDDLNHPSINKLDENNELDMNQFLL